MEPENVKPKENTIPPFSSAGAPIAQLRWEARFEQVTGEPTVEMRFPQDLHLTVDRAGKRIFFRRGINRVPTSLSNHPYLKAAGVILEGSQ